MIYREQIIQPGFNCRSLGLLLLLVTFSWQVSLASEVPQGKYYGAIPSEKPDWFKESFLEFEADVAEAAAAGRRVLLYFHQ
jgi:hypothetical protein